MENEQNSRDRLFEGLSDTDLELAEELLDLHLSDKADHDKLLSENLSMKQRMFLGEKAKERKLRVRQIRLHLSPGVCADIKGYVDTVCLGECSDSEPTQL